MPFAFYARLSRAQQAVYRRSDAVTEIRLRQPSELFPLVTALETALGSENRAATQAATERLIQALTDALAMPRVRVEVLAARPHSGWGELHGLYTAEPGRVPKIQLWMRTAKQRRVVAFRTYLRTLLHEVGHHVDYTHLRLADSYHTEGFYKRESSLFHQLIPEGASPIDCAGKAGARIPDSYTRLTRNEKLERLERTPVAVAMLLRGRSEGRLTKRPAENAWSAAEVVCHLRDAEEHLAGWIELALLMDTPVLPRPSTADRWAEDRQYRRQHAGEAWNAFSRRRDDTLALVRDLAPGEWRRTAVSPRDARVTIDDLVALIAWHDDNHLDQIRRALEGRA